jgi:preprotein translocase SecE subunit
VATNKKTTNKATNTNITRIKAVESPAKVQTPKPVKIASEKREIYPLLKPFVMLGGYFKGAWAELREVRWPTRKATWSLTGAVLLFSAFFVVLILLLDALFKFLFEIIIK